MDRVRRTALDLGPPGVWAAPPGVARLLWSCDEWCWSLADGVDGIKLDDGSFDAGGWGLDMGRDESVVGKTQRVRQSATIDTNRQCQLTHGWDAGRSVRVGCRERWWSNRCRWSQERPYTVVATRIHGLVGMLLLLLWLLRLLAGRPAQGGLTPLVSRQSWRWCRCCSATRTRRARRPSSTSKRNHRGWDQTRERNKKKEKKQIENVNAMPIISHSSISQKMFFF